eukprot:TsM_000199800 transcript=TsM_000199800 gene=TsM_000199800
MGYWRGLESRQLGVTSTRTLCAVPTAGQAPLSVGKDGSLTCILVKKPRSSYPSAAAQKHPKRLAFVNRIVRKNNIHALRRGAGGPRIRINHAALPEVTPAPTEAELAFAADILVEGRLATAVSRALFTASRESAPPAVPTPDASPLVEEEVDTAEDDDQTAFWGVIEKGSDEGLVVMDSSRCVHSICLTFRLLFR